MPQIFYSVARGFDALSSSSKMLRVAVLAAVASSAGGVLYLPGVAPRSYAPEEPLKLYVNKLTSTHTQARPVSPPPAPLLGKIPTFSRFFLHYEWHARLGGSL